MSFINTRDLIGDSAAIDGLVDHTLTELADDSVSVVETYALYSNNGIETLKLLNVTNIATWAFSKCTNLDTVEIGGNDSSAQSLTIGDYSFNGASKLTHFVIDRPNMATLTGSMVFDGTKIAARVGGFYVPSNLIQTYKSSTNWNKFSFFPLTDYPSSTFDTISDSWATILADTNPSAHYSVGDIKTLSLNGVNCRMQIVGFSQDTISSNKLKRASISWITNEIYTTKSFHNNSSNPQSWSGCSLRSWLISDVLPLLEASAVGSELQTVIKTYTTTGKPDYTANVNDKIWVPSYREVLGAPSSSNSTGENQGCTYSRISKYKYNSAENAMQNWWLRSNATPTNIEYLNTAGSTYSSMVDNTYGVIFGFCTGVCDPPGEISDSWATILADTNPSAHYSVGDVKTLDIGTIGMVVQIAGFGLDIIASDSTKRARITWILKDVHYNTQKMNSTNTSVGGWESSNLRSWLISDVLPLLEASAVGSELQTVTKTYRTKSTEDGDATKSCSDKIWIPSHREVGLSSNYYVENEGPIYSGLFINKNARIKRWSLSGSVYNYWLRSASSQQGFAQVDTIGDSSNGNASLSSGIVFGFCTGVTDAPSS